MRCYSRPHEYYRGRSHRRSHPAVPSNYFFPFLFNPSVPLVSAPLSSSALVTRPDFVRRAFGRWPSGIHSSADIIWSVQGIVKGQEWSHLGTRRRRSP